jgi:hypothetical protein
VQPRCPGAEARSCTQAVETDADVISGVDVVIDAFVVSCDACQFPGATC